MELTKPSVLALYSPDTNSKISSDSSSFGLGAVLLQQRADKWRPVAYASQAMSEHRTTLLANRERGSKLSMGM